MCMAKAYVDSGGGRELLLEDVATVECTDRQLRISTLFGETRVIEASIVEVDFQSGSILLESAAASPADSRHAS